MSNITKNEPTRISIIDAVEVIRQAAMTDRGQHAVRHALEARYNPELITLIRGTYADSERFCDGMRKMLADPEEQEWDANVAKYGY